MHHESNYNGKKFIKHYNSFQAVKGISFDVYEGEIFGLLRPNGAGKTTTLEIMENLRTKKHQGEIIIKGYSVRADDDEIKKL